jgi:DNA-binding Xre family transcriptional regulator
MAEVLMKVRKVLEVDALGLGQKIKQARKGDPRTLTELAAAAGMTTANWYVIEAEEIKALPVETLERIQQVLGVDFGVSFDEGHQTLTAGGAR